MTWLICCVWCFWYNNIDVFDEINENVNVSLKRRDDFIDIIDLIVIIAYEIFDVIKNVKVNIDFEICENVLKNITNLFFFNFS